MINGLSANDEADKPKSGPEKGSLDEGNELREEDDKGEDSEKDDGAVEEDAEDDEATKDDEADKHKSEVADLKATPRSICAKIEYEAKPREKSHDERSAMCFDYTELEYKIADLQNNLARTSA